MRIRQTVNQVATMFSPPMLLLQKGKLCCSLSIVRFAYKLANFEFLTIRVVAAM